MTQNSKMGPQVKELKGRTPETGTKEAKFPPNSLMHHPEKTMGHKRPPGTKKTGR
jgi:hypothetical protein